MRTLLLVLCLLAIPASAAAQQTQTASASEVLCAKFEALDAVTRDACQKHCAAWPISPNCAMLRRYGYNGLTLFHGVHAGTDWAAIHKHYPHMREAVEFFFLDYIQQMTWRTAAERDLTISAFKALLTDCMGLIQQGQPERAVACTLDQEKRLVGVFGPDHPLITYATNMRAQSLWHAGRYADALALTSATIKLIERTLGDDVMFLATALETHGTNLMALGDLDPALAALERASAINLLTQGPANPSRAQLLNNIATTQLNRGELTLALATATDALALAERGGTAPQLVPTILNNLATLYARRGEHQRARASFERAIALTAERFGADHPELTGHLNNLALFLSMLGDHDVALTHLKRAATICEQTVGTRHPKYAETLANLASVSLARGDRDAARAFAQQALTLHEELLGKDHPDLALPLFTLAELLLDAGEPAQAILRYDRLIAIEERVFGKDHPRLAKLLIGRSVASLELADLAAATRDADRAVRLVETTQDIEPLQAAESLEVAAMLHAALAKRDPWPQLERAASLRRDAFWRTIQAADSDVQLLQLAGADRINQSVFIDIALQQRRAQALWSALLEHTGRAARAEQLRRGWLHTLAQRPKSADAAWAAYEAAERALRAEQARADASPSADPKRLIDAARALKAAEAALDKKWPARRQARDAALVSADATCAILRAEQAAMIHWVRRPPLPMLRPDTQDRWLAVVVTPAGLGCAITPVDLGHAQPLDAAITIWRDAVQQVEQRLTQRKPPQQAQAAMHAASAALYQQLWAPLAPALGDVQRAYLVPQDRLLEVAFGALIQPDGQPLLARVALAYLPIPAALTAPATRASAPGRGALVVGALDFAASPDADASRWQRCRSGGCQRAPQAALAQAATRAAGGSACGWRALQWPSVGAEAIRVAEALGARWRDQEIWLVAGASARQDALEAHMPGKRVLHFGTHGFFAPAKGCEGQVQHTRAGLLDSAPMRVGLDPMQLSALVLSGANTAAAAAASHLDGALTAREIVALDLSAVEVATLAACETGRGEQVAGEGAQGLSKAFVVAGVREVIVSLWRVPDQETARLMLDLYAALPAKPAPGQATRALIASQRKLAADLAAAGDAHNTFLWAAFIPIVSQPAFGAP